MWIIIVLVILWLIYLDRSIGKITKTMIALAKSLDERFEELENNVHRQKPEEEIDLDNLD